MTLGDYLEANGITAAAFAAKVDVSPVAVHRYVRRGRVPERDVMQRIVDATSGQVRPDDFYPTLLETKPRRRSKRSA